MNAQMNEHLEMLENEIRNEIRQGQSHSGQCVYCSSVLYTTYTLSSMGSPKSL